MSIATLYALVGVGLFALGLHAVIIYAHLLRKILAINVMGSGTFLVFIALARRTAGASPDAVPQAMVITGIVVTISATAMALALMLKLCATTGRAELPDQPDTEG